MLEEIERFTSRRIDFGFETTLAGSYLRLIRDLKGGGYEVNIFFVWIPGVDVALARIRKRVLHGGHNVPGSRCTTGFWTFHQEFPSLLPPLVDSWFVFDNSGRPLLLLSRSIVRFV